MCAYVCMWSVHELVLLIISGLAAIISRCRAERLVPAESCLKQTFGFVCSMCLASGSHIYEGDKQ